MKYKNKPAAIQVRQVTEAELIKDADLIAGPGDPEFKVKVSPVANGWWTRAELAELHSRITGLLDTPVAMQRFYIGDPAEERTTTPEDAARRRGYLPKRIEESTRPELNAAIAAMLADRAGGSMNPEIKERR
jgi:hypothetical protein